MTEQIEVQETTETKQEVKTEVTSIAKEEQKTGTKIEMPTEEELVAKAGSSMIRNLTDLQTLITRKNGGNYVISRKGMNRVLMSILDLPMDDLTVTLQGNEEKLAFAIGQRTIQDRFILIQHHINEQLRKQKSEKDKKELETKENSDNLIEGGKNGDQKNV